MKSNSTYSKGFFKAYAFGLIAVVTIAYAAYYFGNLVVTKPVQLQTEYSKYYNQNENAYYKYSSDPGYDDVNHGDTSFYPNTTVYPNGTANYSTTTYQATGNPSDIGVTVASGANTNTSQSNGSTGVTPNEVAPTTNSPLAVSSGEMDVFTSSINKKISFNVPTGSVVKESGAGDDMTFSVTTPQTKKFTIKYLKDVIGCEDAIASFAIDPSEGVDYRIIHEQKQIALKSTYRAYRAYEEYGTYSGQLGIRMNACVISAVPTRIEIRASGYERPNIFDGFNIMGEILNGFKV